MSKYKDIEAMTYQEKAEHMLEVLNFVERNCDDELISAALIDAGYVIEQLLLALSRKEKA